MSRKESLADLLADLNSDRMALTEQRDALKAEVTWLRELLAEATSASRASAEGSPAADADD